MPSRQIDIIYLVRSLVTNIVIVMTAFYGHFSSTQYLRYPTILINFIFYIVLCQSLFALYCSFTDVYFANKSVIS